MGARFLAGLGLGMATAIKATPVLGLPFFWRAGGWPSALGWAGAGAASALPFIGAGTGLVAGVTEEAGQQQFNDSVHFVVERVARALGLGAPEMVASVVSVAALLGALAMLWRFGDRSPRGVLLCASWALAGYLLVAAVVEPWYLTWLAPLIGLRLGTGRGPFPFALNDAVAWLWLTGVVTLTELSYLPGGTAWWPLIRAVEYVPVYAVLGVLAVGRLQATGYRRQESGPR
jgi:hypothetical protein